MATIAILFSALAIVLMFLASKYQHWLPTPLPAFPTRSSAILAAAVGLNAWMTMLPALSAVFAWLITSVIVAIVFATSMFLRRV